ncbi:la-related protein 6-like [Babylonia areolata]|uniref:la-related protein 6-like n=1 Tax=Babylonia areolata TaxID=304850 RepID=UPI003FD5D8BD
MSGEGKVVTEGADRVGTTEMSNNRHDVHEESPRGSKSIEVRKTNDCVHSSTSEGGATNPMSNDSDHKISAADGFTEPDDELRTKIIKQVEFYFSDANILKDTYLLKHVRRSKSGFISVMIIASFKRVKSLTKDPRVVVFSLRQSVELEINEEGTKVRRRKPMPEYDETTPSRNVVAVNLATKNPTVDSVAEEFSKCRGVTLIRILRPGQSIPPDILKFAYKHPEIGTTVCAVIEFEKEGQAKYTCRTMTNTEDWRNGRRVTLLSNTQKSRKDKRVINAEFENRPSPEDGDGGTGSESKKNKNAGSRKKTHKFAAERKSSDGSETDSSDNSNHHNHSTDSKSNESKPHSSPGSSPCSSRCRNRGKSSQVNATSQNGVRCTHTEQNQERRLNNTEHSQGESSPSSPWVQHRRRAVQDSKSKGSPVSEVAWNSSSQSPMNSRLLDMVGVLRQPRGPDGTKGFSARRPGKSLCNTIA